MSTPQRKFKIARKCTSCLKAKPVTDFDLKSDQSRTQYCTECLASIRRKRESIASVNNRRLELGLTSRLCTKCCKELPFWKFNLKSSKRSDGLAEYTKQCSACLLRSAEAKKRYRARLKSNKTWKSKRDYDHDQQPTDGDDKRLRSTC